MKRLYSAILLSLLAGTAWSLRLTDLYKPGDEYNYAIESGGKVIGTQHAVCKGWSTNGTDSLMMFTMETKSVYSRGGKSFDMDVACEVGYLPIGLPKTYKYTLKLLNVSVSHSGEFGDSIYSGHTERMGVSQPMMFNTKHWAMLFDNNFALQWELALRPVLAEMRDSAAIVAVIPQLNRATILRVYGIPDDKIVFDGSEMSVKAVRVDPVNQQLYFDRAAKLMKAYDPVQKITVRLLPGGEKAEIATESWVDVFMRRLPIFGLLALFTIVWSLPMVYRNFKRIDVAILFVAGAALFWLSLEILKPIQTTYFGMVLDPKGNSGNVYLLMLGSALLFAFVEELTKFGSLMVRMLLGVKHSPKLGIVLGAACGAGFALMQAAYLAPYSATGGVPAGDLVQKFFLIGLNIATGALIGFVMLSRLKASFYLIPLLFKTIFDWLAIFVQKGDMRPSTYTFLSFLLAAVALTILYFLYRVFSADETRGRRTANR